MRSVGITLLIVLAGLTWGPVAQAAFPGQNGKIAYAGVRTVNPDGGGNTQLTTDGYGQEPAWSPDGQRVAFSREDPNRLNDIWVVNADGSGPVRLTPADSHDDVSPAWTPDGTQILWSSNASGTYDIWRMDADGGAKTVVGGSEMEGEGQPAMSPDGTRIAFVRPVGAFHSGQIWVMSSGGADEQLLGSGERPDWSPDGTQIAFHRAVTGLMDPCSGDPDPEPFSWQYDEIFRMHADGTEATQLTATGTGACYVATEERSPVWSPDGGKIAWHSETVNYDRHEFFVPDLSTMDVDGGNKHRIAAGTQPDWQPVQPGYPRPKSAAFVRASLVPAYIQCTSPDRTHGPPLAFPSCSPPQQRSGVLTAGTPDANGEGANMAGSMRLTARPGSAATPADDADVGVAISITDVRCRSTNAACPDGAGSDYEGDLLGVMTGVQITDRLNTPPGPDGVPGTADGVLEVPVRCTSTANGGTGSTCSVGTTMDALLPGAVREGKRSVWELGQIHVRDAGPNGTGYEPPACPPDCGDGDETLFLRQGVFVP
jgi:Tol biopolymer transport system component